MRLFPALLAILALAHIEASPVNENDVAPEKKSMRSMDRSYFRDVLPWRASYNKWFKRSGPEEKRSMMSMDRSMQKPISLRPVSSSWWGKRSMWSMDRANQRTARFLKRSQGLDKQAIMEYLRGLPEADNNNDAVSAEDILAILEHLKEESDQELEQSEGDHGRVKRGDFIPEKKSIRSMDMSYFRDVRPWRGSYSWYKRWGKRSETNHETNLMRDAGEQQGIVDYLRGLSYNESTSPDYRRALLEQIEELLEQELQGYNGRAKRGEPFIPAMGAPSPPVNLFSSGLHLQRLTPSEAE